VIARGFANNDEFSFERYENEDRTLKLSHSDMHITCVKPASHVYLENQSDNKNRRGLFLGFNLQHHNTLRKNDKRDF